MIFPARLVLAATVLVALFGLVLSLWPGRLQDFTFLALVSVCLWGPIAFVVGGWWCWMLWSTWRQMPRSTGLLFELTAIPITLCVTFVLLAGYVPRRIAFRLHRRGFENAVQQVPITERGVPAKLKLGLYEVDEYAVDPRGGVYFRVHAGQDGLGPDTMSYGFVKNPNREGTPFGAAHYHLHPLVSPWYWFAASNDWH